MTDERAIEILDPEHREHYESIEPVEEACRIGIKAIKRVKELEAENADLRARLEIEDKIESRELVEVPKGAVVLTPEERAEEMRLCNEERKQAVKEFAERVKMAFYYEFDELIPSIMADKIDELIEEVCGE